MPDLVWIERRIEARYSELGPQLRRAARFVLRAPAEVALYPLRRVATRAGVAPTTLVRLAEQAGFESYKAFRDAFRDALRSGPALYAKQAEALLSERAQAGFAGLYRETGEALCDGIRASFEAVPAARIEAAGKDLAKARRVFLLGMRSNYSAVFYFHYVVSTFVDNIVLLEDRMGMMIDELGRIGSKDALLVVSYEPYAREAVKAVEYAADVGARIIAFTDTPVSPVARRADHLFVVPTTVTAFYQSMIPTLSLLEGMVCYLAARGGQKTVDRVKNEFARREEWGIYWQDSRTGRDGIGK